MKKTGPVSWLITGCLLMVVGDAMASEPAVSCRVVAQNPGQRFLLMFELSNEGEQDHVIRYFSPFLDFHLEVFADGHPLAVDEAVLDIPVEPKTLELKSGATAELYTPVTVIFEGGEPTEGGLFLLWVIQHEPVPVDLKVILEFEDVGKIRCEGHFEPTTD